MLFALSLLFAVLDYQQPQRISINKLALANNNLAIKLHKTFDHQGNAFTSPVSIFTALGMLYTGARGETARQMRHTLSYDTAGLRDETINEHFQDMLDSFSNAPEEGKLEIANAIIAKKKYPISNGYKETLKNYYEAIAKEVDFTNQDEAIGEVNSWVSEKTRGRIPKLLETLDEDTVLVLLNAVYFKGTWAIPFNPVVTKEGVFYNNGHTAVNVPMMVQENELFFGTFSEYGVQALKLSYVGDKVSMIILLPFQKDGLRMVEEKLTATTLDTIVPRLKEENVIVKIPKFKLEDSRELKQNFERLGMEMAFSDNANFGGINKEAKLKVSRIVHKAMVEVNEVGTEAAGATAIIIHPYILKETSYFIVEHPFLFFIRENVNGMILFSGRVTEL